MNQTKFGRWEIQLDAVATRNAYSKVESGSPEICACTPCLNFAAQRSGTFPDTILSFLNAAGVPLDREAETYHNCRLESGLHSYGGWYHFVGKLISGTDAFVSTDGQSGTFDLQDFNANTHAGITTKTALVNSAFNSMPILQLEFAVEIPWVIRAEEVG